MIKRVILAAATVLATSVPALACTQISSATLNLTACVADEWVQIEGSGAQEFAYNTADGNFGLTIITEKEVFPTAAFRDAIVKNATNATGGDETKVRVIGERVEAIAGKEWNVLEYAVDIQGQDLTFQNFYYTQPGFGSVQILAYSLTSMATSAAWKAGVFAGTVTTP